MRWQDREGSSNVEDRRGLPVRGFVGGGIGTIIIVLLVYFLGGDPTGLINDSQMTDATQEPVSNYR